MDKIYELKTNSGEVISKVNAESLEGAIKLFSEIKRLSVDTLLSIYEVSLKNS